MPLPQNFLYLYLSTFLLSAPDHFNQLKKFYKSKLLFTNKTSPILHFYNFLIENKLTCLPADKLNTLTLIDKDILKEISLEHLSDKNIYKIITINELTGINNKLLSYIPAKHLQKNFSLRNFFLLPKILKNLNEWKQPFHLPKFRPIISDINSISCRFSKSILPNLQIIESTFNTVCLNSLEIIDFLNNKYAPTSKTTHQNLLLVTADVESLFTNIPLNKLYDILKDYSIPISGKGFSLETLQLLIFNNTFTAYDKLFLQTKGIPMGGCLSSCLANIYLGHLEKNIIENYSSSIILYKRYMDDILILFNNNTNILNQFLLELKLSFQINITSNISKLSTNYLDLNIFKNTRNSFTITPFHKNKNPLINLPLQVDHRPFKTFFSLTSSQLLRIWRISNNIFYFNQTLNKILLQVDNKNKTIKIINSFLEPVKLNKIIYPDIENFYYINPLSLPIFHIQHILCQECTSIVESKHLFLPKSITIGNQTISSMKPSNCKTKDLLILLLHFNQLSAKLIGPTNVRRAISYCDPYSTLLILTEFKMSKMKRIIDKFCKINIPIEISMPKPTNEQIDEMNRIPCFIHQICQSPSEEYGMPVSAKKKKTLYTLLKKTI